MVLRPEDIEQREFGSALRGFDKAEVRAFLRRVAGEVRYLESEVDAAKSHGSPPLKVREPIETMEGVQPLGDDSRPAPPLSMADSGDGGANEDRLPNLGVPGSELPVADGQPEDQAHPTPAVEPDAPAPLSSRIAAVNADSHPAEVPQAAEGPRGGSVQVDADQFAALGDRIANLLRNAQETAEQVRQEADYDARQLRSEAAAASEELRTSADTYSIEVRSAADADAASNRRVAEELLAAAQSEAAEIREHALADANEMRTAAANELESARADVPQIRQRAIDEGRATLASREAEIAQRETEVAAERQRALVELADARSQVSVLLQEARAQSEFIRQESEEIIRTKVRANMEQAQRRIDMLRTTETASKDRIAAARKELESAMARLEAEPVPSLPPGTEEVVLDEARRGADETERFEPLGRVDRQDRIGQTPIDVFEATGSESARSSVETDEFGADDLDTNVEDSSVEDSSVEDSSFEDSSFEDSERSEIAEDQTGGIEFEYPAESDSADDEVVDASIFGTPERSLDTAEVTSHDVLMSSDSDIVSPGSWVGDDAATGVVPPPPLGFERPVGVDAPVFSAPERPQPTDPLESLIPPDPRDDDVQVSDTSGVEDGSPELSTPDYGVPEAAEAAYSPEPVADHTVFGQPHPAEDAADVDTPEDEDALAKLVREAMQRAVDSARGKEG